MVLIAWVVGLHRAGWVRGDDTMSDRRAIMLRLNTGAPMPAIGLGTWGIRPKDVDGSVRAAIASGYRLLDLGKIRPKPASVPTNQDTTHDITVVLGSFMVLWQLPCTTTRRRWGRRSLLSLQKVSSHAALCS